MLTCFELDEERRAADRAFLLHAGQFSTGVVTRCARIDYICRGKSR